MPRTQKPNLNALSPKSLTTTWLLQESMKRINLLNSDSGAMVDRRIVVKLLVTFFQRGQSPEILDLMARMLGLSGAAPLNKELHSWHHRVHYPSMLRVGAIGVCCVCRNCA